jgi:hypothetical protein
VEYDLTGSYRRAAGLLGCSPHRIREWAEKAELAQTGPWKKAQDRREELRELRRIGLDQLYNRVLELQARDLEEADFRDRTGLLKIVGEQRQLATGEPTSIRGQVPRRRDP